MFGPRLRRGKNGGAQTFSSGILDIANDSQSGSNIPVESTIDHHFTLCTHLTLRQGVRNVVSDNDTKIKNTFVDLSHLNKQSTSVQCDSPGYMTTKPVGVQTGLCCTVASVVSVARGVRIGVSLGPFTPVETGMEKYLSTQYGVRSTEQIRKGTHGC